MRKRIYQYLSSVCFLMLVVKAIRVDGALFWWLCGVGGAILIVVSAFFSCRHLMIGGCFLRIVFHIENFMFYFLNPSLFHGRYNNTIAKYSLMQTFGWCIVYSMLIAANAKPRSAGRICSVTGAVIGAICVGSAVVVGKESNTIFSYIPILIGVVAYGFSINEQAENNV